MTESETVAGVQILAAIARADGRIDDRERAALGRALDEFKPAGAPSVEALLAQTIDFDAACAMITSRDAQRAVFAAAAAMAQADGTNTPEERALVARLRTAFGLSDAPENAFAKVLGSRWWGARTVEPIVDPAQRRDVVRGLILTRASIAAIFGALPTPGLDAVLVGLEQHQLLQAIAARWGTTITPKQFVASSIGVVSSNAAILAVSSFLKIVPIWGHALGAGIAFVNTFTLGVVFNNYLEHDGKMSEAEIREAMTRARREARSAFDSNRVRIDAAQKATGPTLETLTQDFQDGKLSVEEFERRVGALEHLGPAPVAKI